MATQLDWRFCQKCSTMFYNGYSQKGVCPAGGVHQAAGYNFDLPHDIPGTPTAQTSWRFCQKCTSMFYDGYPQKGVCSAGGGHQAAGYKFVLPHDVPGTPTAQTAWRFCQKCSMMFYDGYPQKGVCPAGGGHQAAGYMFVLPHHLSIALEIRPGVRKTIFVNGQEFTPKTKLRIDYLIAEPPNYQPRNSASSEQAGQADSQGGFSIELRLSNLDYQILKSPASTIAVRVTDLTTNKFAETERVL